MARKKRKSKIIPSPPIWIALTGFGYLAYRYGNYLIIRLILVAAILGVIYISKNKRIKE